MELAVLWCPSIPAGGAAGVGWTREAGEGPATVVCPGTVDRDRMGERESCKEPLLCT